MTYDREKYRRERFNRTRYNGTTALGARRVRWVEVGDRSLGVLVSLGNSSKTRKAIGWKREGEAISLRQFPTYPDIIGYQEMEFALAHLLDEEKTTPHMLWHPTNTPEGTELALRLRVWRMAQHALWDRRQEQQRQIR